MLIALVLDREAAGALVLAAHLLRAELDRQDRPVPEGFDQLAALAARVVNSPPESSGVAADLPDAATAATVNGNMPDYLTRAEYAKLTRVSVSTVDREIAAGTLPVLRLGRTVRIPNPKE